MEPLFSIVPILVPVLAPVLVPRGVYEILDWEILDKLKPNGKEEIKYLK